MQMQGIFTAMCSVTTPQDELYPSERQSVNQSRILLADKQLAFFVRRRRHQPESTPDETRKIQTLGKFHVAQRRWERMVSA
jgi:hypothetical protein